MIIGSLSFTVLCLATSNFVKGFSINGGVSCDDGQFQCDEFKCIPGRWVCDGSPDCRDSSDEQDSNCPEGVTIGPKTCGENQFTCDNGQCLPLKWRCDGADDCGDASDEKPQNCNIECGSSEFKCGDGQCIARSWVCDSKQDCEDASDELGCERKMNRDTFLCSNRVNIPKTWVCDGDTDCADGGDETDCDTKEVEEPNYCNAAFEFACHGRQNCILKVWVCDGEHDCPGGEDESNCSASITTVSIATNETVNATTVSQMVPTTAKTTITTTTTTTEAACSPDVHFRCSEGECIDKEKMCDGHQDCRGREDESELLCGINECARNNGGCMQICTNRRQGHECACAEGYRLVGRYNCEDINECTEVPGACSQGCANSQGGFRCSCLPGYLRDPADLTRCKAAEGEVYLLFSHSYDIRRLRLRDRDMTSVVKDTRSAIALDYLFNDGKILWSDKKDKKIYRANLNDTSNREVLQTSHDIAADGLAVDWIHHNVYYTDTARSAINLLSWDGKHLKTLVKEDLGHPRAVVVAPMKGYIYWTDWGTNAKIERAYLDGSERKAIVSHDHVAWPNGLTLDPSTEKIFWCDGRLRTISSANLDGSEVKVVLYSPTFLRQPFSISVFEDRLYWADWTKTALFSADKFTGGNIQNVSAGHLLESPKVVHVFHQYRQPQGENICAGHTCDHFCMRSVVGSLMCACADGYIIQRDGKTCVDENEAQPIETTTATRRAFTTTSLLTKIKIVMTTASTYEIGESEKEEAVASMKEGFTLYKEVERSSQVGFIIGGTFGALIAIAVIFALYVTWTRIRQKPIKAFRFHNSVYRKTTAEDNDDERGYTIDQDQILFSPSIVSQLSAADEDYTEADNAPLTPREYK